MRTVANTIFEAPSGTSGSGPALYVPPCSNPQFPLAAEDDSAVTGVFTNPGGTPRCAAKFVGALNT